MEEVPDLNSDHLDVDAERTSPTKQSIITRDAALARLERIRRDRRSVDESTYVDPLQPVIEAPRGPKPGEIEVSPGYFLPLHGTSETMRAMEEGCMVAVTCMVCEDELYCTHDASFLLCPTCRVVSPFSMEDASNFAQTGGGVGLGLTRYNYENWKRENRRF